MQRALIFVWKLQSLLHLCQLLSSPCHRFHLHKTQQKCLRAIYPTPRLTAGRSHKPTNHSQTDFCYICKIIECFELEGTIKGHLVQLPCKERGHLQLHQVLRSPSSLTLGVSKGGAPTTSLCNLCQCLTRILVGGWLHARKETENRAYPNMSHQCEVPVACN